MFKQKVAKLQRSIAMKCALAGSFLGINTFNSWRMYAKTEHHTFLFLRFLCSTKFLSCSIYQTVFHGVGLFGNDYFLKQFEDHVLRYSWLLCFTQWKQKLCSCGCWHNKLASTEGRFYSWVLKSWKPNSWYYCLNHRATSSTSLVFCDSFIGDINSWFLTGVRV